MATKDWHIVDDNLAELAVPWDEWEGDVLRAWGFQERAGYPEVELATQLRIYESSDDTSERPAELANFEYVMFLVDPGDVWAYFWAADFAELIEVFRLIGPMVTFMTEAESYEMRLRIADAQGVKVNWSKKI